MSSPSLDSIRRNQHNNPALINDLEYLEFLLRCYDHQMKIYGSGAPAHRFDLRNDWIKKIDEVKMRIAELVLLGEE